MAVPKVTFLLVARDEERYIAAAIRAGLRQEYPSDLLEILVIIDPATKDGTEPRARMLASAEGNGRVKVIRAARSSLAEGWNEGIRCATGDYIVRIDVHGDAPPDSVRRCLDAVEQTCHDGREKVVIGGTCKSEESLDQARPAIRRHCLPC